MLIPFFPHVQEFTGARPNYYKKCPTEQKAEIETYKQVEDMDKQALARKHYVWLTAQQ